MAILEFGNEIDDETAEKWLEEYGQYPSDFGRFDDRLYDTHFPMFGWANRGDDILSESNFRTILAYLKDVEKSIREETGDESGEWVFDGTVGHWAVGSLSQIYVQARDENGDILPIFREAVSIFDSLRNDYPVFDDQDYSELEDEYTEKAFDDEWAYITSDFENVTDEMKAEVHEEWSQSYYGYHEPGYVDPDDIRSAMDSLGIKLVEDEETAEYETEFGIKGETALDGMETI